jgi:hypothetical protein
MQKSRIFNKTFIFFQKWQQYKDYQSTHLYFIYFYRILFIKLKFFKKFKRKIRKNFRRKRLFFYFFCKPNFLIQEKSKNSRMGKGKGLPVMWIYKPKVNKPFVILGNIHIIRAYKIMGFLKKYLNKYMYIKIKE